MMENKFKNKLLVVVGVVCGILISYAVVTYNVTSTVTENSISISLSKGDNNATVSK